MADYFSKVCFWLPRGWPEEARNWVAEEINRERKEDEDPLGAEADTINERTWIQNDDQSM